MKLSYLLLGAFVVGVASAVATEVVERLAARWFGAKA
jgi:hypothetical protein